MYIQWLFGGDVPSHPLELHQVAARAIVVYIVGLLVIRVGKSRLVGRVAAVDILVGFILGSLLSRGITGNASLSGTIMASISVVALHWIVTWLSVRSHWFGGIAKGHAVQLVHDGDVLTDNMSSSHISEHDLAEALRLQGVDDLTDVRDSYKERNGDISVIRQNAQASQPARKGNVDAELGRGAASSAEASTPCRSHSAKR